MKTNYEEFRRYLKHQDKDKIYLSIDEIEKIIGGKLCKSAYKYSEWWSGISHPLSKIWLEEGMKRESLKLGEYVILTKVDSKDKGKRTGNKEKNVEELKRIGFEYAGKWHTSNNGIRLELHEVENKSNILYSFVVDKSIKYIGKTTKSLLKRMKLYEKPGATQVTNIRNNSNIKEALKANQQVEIFYFKEVSVLEYKGYEVNLSAGLEDDLIKKLSPEWNIAGK